MENYRRRLRSELRQPPEQRQVAPGVLPAAKRQSGDGSGQSSSHDRSVPAKFGLGLLAAKDSAKSNDHTNWHPQANQVSDEFRKLRPGTAQHCIGRNGMEYEQINSEVYRKPKKQRGAQAPDQARPGRSRAS